MADAFYNIYKWINERVKYQKYDSSEQSTTITSHPLLFILAWWYCNECVCTFIWVHTRMSNDKLNFKVPNSTAEEKFALLYFFSKKINNKKRQIINRFLFHPSFWEEKNRLPNYLLRKPWTNKFRLLLIFYSISLANISRSDYIKPLRTSNLTIRQNPKFLVFL